jgi:ESCRT-II complex subunit VPS36
MTSLHPVNTGADGDEVLLSQWTPLECLPPASFTLSGLVELESGGAEVELFSRVPVDLRTSTGKDNGSQLEPLGPPLHPVTGYPISCQQVDSMSLSWHGICRNLVVMVTTHRIIFVLRNPPASPTARYVHLSHLMSPPTPETQFLKSPKLVLNTAMGELVLAFVKGTTDAKRDRDDCLACITKSMTRQEWQVAEKLALEERARQAALSRRVGVDAILTAHQRKHEHAQKVTQSAFNSGPISSSVSSSKTGPVVTRGFKKKESSDDTAASAAAEQFLSEAAELIQVIHRYVATLERQNETGARAGTGDTDEEDDEEAQAKLADLLSDMGVASALSSSKGDSTMYRENLARQVADFIRPKLGSLGGYITLTDLYCRYNRARATNLISPEDLLGAVQLMGAHGDDYNKKDASNKKDKAKSQATPRLSLGMSLRTFPSGLIVLQDDSVDETSYAAKLADLAVAAMSFPEKQQGSPDGHGVEVGGITPDIVASQMHISAVLAKEQLLAAEQLGSLVRDETVEGIRYFPNLFPQYVQEYCKRR